MASAADAVLYVDSSAIVKLIVEEPESFALREAIAPAAIVSSELTLAEVPRAIWRLRTGRNAAEQRGLLAGLETVLASIAFVPLDRDLLVAAGSFREAFLRTLDAIHVASALAISDAVASFVTYDERQAEVAEHAGFTVVAPSAQGLA